MRRTARISMIFGLSVVGAFAAVWILFAIPLFSDFRRAIVADALSEQIGQPILVNGDVSVLLGPVSTIRASGVQIPSENIEGVNLAELARLEFDVDLIALSGLRLDIDNLIVDGLKVELLTLEDGTQSWSDADEDATASETNDASTLDFAPPEQGLLGFLRTRTASFTNIRLFWANKGSGFEYDFNLEEFTFGQLDDGTTLRVESAGTVNDQSFSLTGTYPKNERFTTSAQFSSIELNFEGTGIPRDEGGGFTSQITVDARNLGDVLEVLKLNRTFDGDGLLRTNLTATNGTVSLSDFSTKVELSEGQLISVEGDVTNLTDVDGIDVAIDVLLFSEGEPPPKATRLRELQLTGISTRIVSVDRQLEFEDLLVTTNYFEQGLNEVGPATIRRIRRTDDGKLAFDDIYLQTGPIDDPILVATGSVGNVLEGEEIALQGSVNAPASLLLGSLGEDVADAFGGVQAEFSVDDAQGFLSISRLAARAVDTDVWALDAELRIGDVATLDGFSFDYAVEVADGKEFFSALNLEEIDTGPLGLSMSIRGEEGLWDGEMMLGAGQSELTASVDTRTALGRTIIDAEIVSETLSIKDLTNSIDGAIELANIRSRDEAGDRSSDIELQPLVLPKEEDVIEPAVSVNDNEIELQPLVLPKEEDDIVDLDRFLRETDIYATIEFEEISGIQGVSRISSEFISEGGKASLGPLEFTYGGGYFNIGAKMDAVETPDVITIAGNTAGWNLGDIMMETGIGIDATGALTGRFDLNGDISSIKGFLSSLTGSATVRMANGRLGTSLLELAGLGIFPWLFSKEMNKGYTDIACANVPVRFTAGLMSFNAAVVETNSVQLVAKGTVDLKSETLAIRAEPRPLGRPLARSAFPFDVRGDLSNPQFELDLSGSRVRRADGADQMPANRIPCQPDIFQLEQSGG